MLTPSGTISFNLEYEKMYNDSPVAHLGGRVAPALLMLGDSARRVPPSQGKRWGEVFSPISAKQFYDGKDQ